MKHPAWAGKRKSIESAGLSAFILSITPNIATQMLAENVSNRKLKSGLVARYSNAIKKGQWKLNGSAVVFSSDGQLLDGQHRLHSIVQTGVPVSCMVVYGVQPKTMDTIDTGKSRSHADLMFL